MKFEIHSHEGAGPIRFGMSPAQVREALGSEFTSSHRGSTAYDHYDEYGCFVYYDKNGEFKAIEFHSRGEPMLEGVKLIGQSFKDVLALVTARDPDVEVDIEGFTSLELGIGTYAPDGEDDPESPVENLIVFRPGYYDEPVE